MACPQEWDLGERVWVEDVGWRECWDHGGAIVCDTFEIDGAWERLCIVDIQVREPIVTDMINRRDGAGYVPFRYRLGLRRVSQVELSRPNYR